MILIISYLVNSLAPIVNTIGLFGLIGSIVYEAPKILIIAGALFVVGLLFGIFAHRMDIPPRWFWSKSKNEIFGYSITAGLGYAWSFAMWPCAVYFVTLIV